MNGRIPRRSSLCASSFWPRQGSLPQVRANALWSLEGLKALRDEDIIHALTDPVAQVRAHAVQLIGKRLHRAPALVEKLVPLAADADTRVRFQVALALGEMPTHDSATCSWPLLTEMRQTAGFARRCSAHAVPWPID